MKTNLIKPVFLLVILIIAFIFPVENDLTLRIALYISIPIFIFGLLFPLLLSVSGLSFNIVYERPLWASKLNERNPLTYIHLLGFICFSAGLGGFIGNYIFDKRLNYISLLLILFGICLLFGIYLTLKTIRKK